MENVVIDSLERLTITIERGVRATVQAKEPGQPTFSIIGSSEITIEGLTVTGGTPGIVIQNSSSITLNEDKINGNPAQGLSVTDSADVD